MFNSIDHELSGAGFKVIIFLHPHLKREGHKTKTKYSIIT